MRRTSGIGRRTRSSKALDDDYEKEVKSENSAVVAGKKISLELLNFELKLSTLQRKLLDLKLELRALEPKLLLAKLVELDGGADVGGGDDGTRRLHRPEADVGSADASSFSPSGIAASWFVIVQLSNKWSMSTMSAIYN